MKERHYVGRGMYERSSDFIQYAPDIVFLLLFFLTYNTCRNSKTVLSIVRSQKSTMTK